MLAFVADSCNEWTGNSIARDNCLNGTGRCIEAKTTKRGCCVVTGHAVLVDQRTDSFFKIHLLRATCLCSRKFSLRRDLTRDNSRCHCENPENTEECTIQRDDSIAKMMLSYQI